MSYRSFLLEFFTREFYQGGRSIAGVLGHARRGHSDGEAEGDHLGRAVAMPADGSRVTIGVSGSDGNDISSDFIEVLEYSTSSLR